MYSLLLTIISVPSEESSRTSPRVLDSGFYRFLPNKMVADKGKKAKLSEKGEDDNSEVIDEKLVISIEKLQEIQDELEKVLIRFLISFHLVFSFGGPCV